METVNEIIDLINNYVGILSLLVPIVAAAFLILFNKRKKTYFTQLFPVLYGFDYKIDKTRFKYAYKRFENYVQHTLVNVDVSDNRVSRGEEQSFSEFCDKIQDSPLKCIFVTGPSGIGKSAFLQQLSYRMKKSKVKYKSKGLADYGILYYKFNADPIETIFTSVSEKISRENSKYIILLDGFDESEAFVNGSVNEAFDRLFTQMRTLNSQDFDKIIITLRSEVFSEINNRIQATTLFSCNTAVYEINKFNKAQTLKMYKKVSAEKGESRKLRNEHVGRLSRLIDSGRENIFTYPFIVEWAPELLGEMKNDELQFDNMYWVIDTIIGKALEREYDIIKLMPAEKVIDKGETVSSGRSFLRAAALRMMKNNCISNCLFKYDEVEALGNPLNGFNSVTVNTTRRLLIHSENGFEDGRVGYTFIHNMFYWFEVVDILSDFDNTEITPEIRSRYLELFESNATQVPYMYMQSVFKKANSVLVFKGGIPRNPLDVRNLVYRNSGTVEAELTVDRICPFFPNVQTLTLNGVTFNERLTADILQNRKIDLSEKGAQYFFILSSFTCGYFKFVDISSCGITDCEKIRALLDDGCGGPDELHINGNSVSFSEVCRCLSGFKNTVLYCDFNDCPEISSSEIKLKGIKLYIHGAQVFDPAYIAAYNLQKSGLPVSLAEPCRPAACDCCSDPVLLKAVFELSRPAINMADDGDLFALVRIAELYVCASAKICNTAKIDFVYNSVVPCISVNDSYIRLIKNKSLYASSDKAAVLFNFFALAAENGDACIANALLHIGVFYHLGDCVKKDDKLAFSYYRKSAENSDAGGMCYLGWCYEHAIGTEKDENQAFYWYKKSAENGDAGGMNNLGWCYEFAIGTEKDEKQAFYWYKKSAENGDEAGVRNLRRCFEAGIGTENDEKNAAYWHQESEGKKIGRHRHYIE